MADRTVNKPTGPTKSFMTVGPTLHYSHANVRRCWGLAIVVFVGACVFWSKILTGRAFFLDPGLLADPSRWGLGQFIDKPISIYEYPWQILVLGVLMGIMGSSGVVISQLMSFRYSIPFIVSVAVVARLPLFAVILLISCIAVACRPLRFRSRFIAVALCLTPQLIYWGVFGGSENVDPLRWGISYSSWICAWFTGLAIAGIVIGIGHFTRYRPGLVWVVTAGFLGIAIFTFQSQISFSELDYQLYIAGNNPEELREFHDHDILNVLDEALEDSKSRKTINERFFPTDPEPLKKEMAEDIADHLSESEWPFWLDVPTQLQYQKKRRLLLAQYDYFIDKHPTNTRMPIALYYKGMLEEYIPDVRMFDRKGILSFHNNYPQRKSVPTWQKLFYGFAESDESLESRWRIAVYMAGRGEFTKAGEHCTIAKVRVKERLEELEKSPETENVSLPIFSQPRKSVMTVFKLKELLQRLNRFEALIGNEKNMESIAEKKRLAEFVTANPYHRSYGRRLEEMLEETKEGDRLRDNLLLAQIMLTENEQVRATRLHELSLAYPQSDGGIEALYKYAMLNVRLWKSTNTAEEEKIGYLLEGRSILNNFIEMHPESALVAEARSTLESLPQPK